MTHGCILVIGEGHPNGILLHTSHDGMDIPKIVYKAICLVADRHFYFESREGARSGLKSNGRAAEYFSDPEAVAALLIAAEPMTLEYVFGNDATKLAEWSGANTPYKLEITPEHEWKLTNQDGTLSVTFDPIELFIERFPPKKIILVPEKNRGR